MALTAAARRMPPNSAAFIRPDDHPDRDTSILVFRILNGFLTDKFKMVAGEGNAAVCAWERFYAFPSAVPSALIELGLNRVKDLSVLHRSSSWHPPITADE
jgi:hypothetical protein